MSGRCGCVAARPRCERRERREGVYWVPANRYEEICARRVREPCVVDDFPFEPIETFRDPVTHQQFLKARGIRT